MRRGRGVKGYSGGLSVTRYRLLKCWEGCGTVLGGGWNSVVRGVEQCWEGGGTVL